jgi:hypothetical protein
METAASMHVRRALLGEGVITLRLATRGCGAGGSRAGR